MTYATSPAGFGAFTGQSTGNAAKPGFLRRAFDAFMSARQKQANSEIERYFAQSGHLLTDSVEREMMQRVIRNGWSPLR